MLKSISSSFYNPSWCCWHEGETANFLKHHISVSYKWNMSDSKSKSAFWKSLTRNVHAQVGMATLCVRAQSRDANAHALWNVGRSSCAPGIIIARHNKTENWRITFRKFSNIKFQEEFIRRLGIQRQTVEHRYLILRFSTRCAHAVTNILGKTRL